MATSITPQTLNGPYPSDGVAVTFTAGDTDGMTFRSSGKDLVIVHNTHGANPYTVTITSAALPPSNRTGDITADSIPFGEFHHYYLTGPGWADGNGMVNLDVENAAVEVAVIRL